MAKPDIWKIPNEKVDSPGNDTTLDRQVKNAHTQLTEYKKAKAAHSSIKKKKKKKKLSKQKKKKAKKQGRKKMQGVEKTKT